jgi:hypothetical protein
VTPFPTGRKLAAGIVKFLPTRRKFRKNLLDNIACLCASLRGRCLVSGVRCQERPKVEKRNSKMETGNSGRKRGSGVRCQVPGMRAG